MNWQEEWKTLLWIVVLFLGCYYLPVGEARFDKAILEAFHLIKWYAREHVILCLIPAFFIAGAISVFVSQAAVMKYLGPKANKLLAYGVASVSGTILAVCSCTVLPLFAGIYKMGAGLGPACAFLYSGPAINVLAIFLTARVLGVELGIARAIGAIVFSVLIGLCMHLIFRDEELEKANAMAHMPEPEEVRPLWQNVIYFASMVAILVFANWGAPQEQSGLWFKIHKAKWLVTSFAALAFSAILVRWLGIAWHKVGAALVMVVSSTYLYPATPMVPFVVGIISLSIVLSTEEGEGEEWFSASWGFTKQILPLLMMGVLVAGVLLGRPGAEGLIPSHWVAQAVGGNSLWANLFASIAGAFMYFATLTEVPILEGLIGSGMGKGPALAMLLAGPALSLPNMLVIQSVMGTKKTCVFVSLVVVMATISGLIFGNLF